MPRGETIVYSTMGAAKGRLYERACMGGSCFRDYDGSEDSLFRSSTTVACGYEIGWEFVDSVMTSKQTFSGFVKVVKNRYTDYQSPCEFMSRNTLIKWWFSWASAMDLDFVQKCPSCGSDPKYLAADATKIGITFKQINVTPIEQPVGDSFPQFETLNTLLASVNAIEENSDLWRVVEEFHRSSKFFFPELGDWLFIVTSLSKGSAPSSY